MRKKKKTGGGEEGGGGLCYEEGVEMIYQPSGICTDVWLSD